MTQIFYKRKTMIFYNIPLSCFNTINNYRVVTNKFWFFSHFLLGLSEIALDPHSQHLGAAVDTQWDSRFLRGEGKRVNAEERKSNYLEEYCRASVLKFICNKSRDRIKTTKRNIFLFGNILTKTYLNKQTKNYIYFIQWYVDESSLTSSLR